MSDAPLYIKKGGLVGLPPAGSIALSADSSGNVQKTDESGTTSALGSGGSSDFVAAVVSTSNLSLTGAATIDGVVLTNGQTVLASAQSTGSQNGLYTVNTGGAWTRLTAFSTAAQMQAAYMNGTAVRVLGGTVGVGSIWLFTTSGTITVGTTALTFTEVPGGGALAGQTLAQARLTLNPQYFVQAAGNVQTLTLSGLNGNADGDYDLEVYVTCNHGGSTFILLPNSAITNTESVYGDMLTGSGAAGAIGWPLYGTTAGAAAGVSSPGTLLAQGVVRTLTGVGAARQVFLDGEANLNGTIKGIVLRGRYNDTSTNVTSLQISASTSDGIGIGSYIKAVALGRS